MPEVAIQKVNQLRGALCATIGRVITETNLAEIQGGALFVPDETYEDTAAGIAGWSQLSLDPENQARQKSVMTKRIHLPNTALQEALAADTIHTAPSQMHEGLHTASLPVQGGAGTVQLVSTKSVKTKIDIIEETYEQYAVQIAYSAAQLVSLGRDEISGSIGDGLLLGQPIRPNGVYIGHDMTHSTEAMKKNEGGVTRHALRLNDAFDRVFDKEHRIKNAGDGAVYFLEFPDDLNLNDATRIRSFGATDILPRLLAVVGNIKDLKTKYRTRIALQVGYYERGRTVGQRDLWELDDMLENKVSRLKPVALGMGKSTLEAFGLRASDLLDIERHASV